MTKHTAYDMTNKIVRTLNVRTQLVVPNVSWGLVLWGECDLLVMSGSGYLTEYEMKISASDISREWRKARWTRQTPLDAFRGMIKNYYMVVPKELETTVRKSMPSEIGGGIIVIDYEWPRGRIGPKIVREAKTNSGARKLTDKEQFQMARLGTLRYWTKVAQERKL